MLRDVCLSVPPEGITVVVGPSGAGKSTLLRCCNRLDVPTHGRVCFRGDDVAGLDPRRLRRRVGMVFQQPTPFPGTVRDNLRAADPSGDDASFGALLDRVGLTSEFLDVDARAVSGGEAQRVCLARTLATAPEVLLADEPTASLDPPARHGLEALGRTLAATGVPMLWVSHDLAQMHAVADYVVVLWDGRVVHAAPLARLFDGAPPAVGRFLEGGAPGAAGSEHDGKE